MKIISLPSFFLHRIHLTSVSFLLCVSGFLLSLFEFEKKKNA